MLNRIVETSIRLRGIVLALAIMLVGYGVYSTMNAKLDVFPDFIPPQAVIQTEAPGLPPEQVETLVTLPIETMVGGIVNLESVRSQSISGLSIVTVVFKEGTDIFNARQMLNERLSEIAGELPVGVRSPKMTPLTSATMDLLKMGLTSDQLSPMELRSFADWVLRPRLQAITGVASVGVMGGEVRQLQIQLDSDRLRLYGISMDQVFQAARNATGVRGAGFLENPNQRITLRTEGQSITPQQLGETVIENRSGMAIRIKDIARVVEAAEPKVGDALIQNQPGVLVKLLSQYGANTMEVTRTVEMALEEMKPAFEAQHITLYPHLHRPATFIEISIHHVSRALMIGGILVVIVLFLFLYNLRTALISITAIPLSLMTAIIILEMLGQTLNTITLGGLAIAIGEVVDDAIIDVENIFRRLRENMARSKPLSPLKIVLDASVEVRSAVVYATFVVVLVFLPVLTLSGLQGKFFAPLGLAYILAILASLAVALTVTPALAALLLPQKTRSAREPAFLKHLKDAYRRLMGIIVPRTGMLMLMAGIATVWAVSRIPKFGGEFLPEFREGHFVLQASALPGTSLDQMMRTGKQICSELLTIPEIDTVEQQAGRAELGEDPWGPHRSEIHVELKPDVPGDRQQQVQSEIRDILARYPGITYEVLTFLGDRIGESISGETAAVVVNIFGEDLDQLDAKAQEVASVLSTISGAADVSVASPPGAPEMVVQLRPERLLQYGFQPVAVLDIVQTAYQGTTVSQVYEGNRIYNVVVILDEAHRRSVDDLAALQLRNSEGTWVRLSTLADIYPNNGRYMILHDSARRRQTVTCNVESRDVASFVDEARRKIADAVHLPAGVYTEFSGEAQARASARNEILLHSGIAGVGIILLLSMVFENIKNLLLVLVNLPFALIGGVLAVFVSSREISIGSLIGFVTLFGITMRNSVMMISHWEHLVMQEGAPWNVQTLLRGASERLIPILMTALVTGLGLLPIALGSGEPGREIEGPMAIVILGGLATSTLLNLLILPALAFRFGQFSINRAEAP